MTALGHALRWLERRGGTGTAVAGAVTGAATGNGRTGRTGQQLPGPGSGTSWSEAAARDLLARSGVPVVPGELVTSAEGAVAAARRLGLPVVLKVCSAQIPHKSDIGGVAVGPATEAEVLAAYERVRAAGEAVPGARIDGVLVSPMRAGGVQLIAGVTVDPTFGPVLAVGLGGVWVEVLGDTSLRVLPVDAGEVKRMLAELRGSPLLRGARGGSPVDLDALAEVIRLLGDTAVALNGSLCALEVNPLWAEGDRVEALDVLLVTRSESPDRSGHHETGGQR
jgi:acetate---CoA ligase (ADP-forming)